ncbi:MAG: prolipoprotein diacylglyceryl transferase [bacterium]|nr:prolipoprotein diacylglyceryl transferase [bacterium]
MQSHLFEHRFPIATLWEGPAVLVRPGYRAAGGFIAAFGAAPLVSRCLRLPFRRLADTLAPVPAIVLAVGRLGCFFASCCFGKVSSLPLATQYPPGTEPFFNHVARGLISATAPHSLGVHPLQLYFSVSAGCTAVCLLALRGRQRYEGQLALLMAALLSWQAVALEPLRELAAVQSVPGRFSAPLISALLLSGVLVWNQVSVAKDSLR